MHLLGEVFTSEHGEAVTVLQLLTKVKISLSEIDAYLNEYGNRLNSIDFLNVTQQQEINILKSQVQTLQTNVSNLQLTVGDYLLRFQDLDIQLSGINDKITNNTSDIYNLNGLISSIQTSITNIDNQIDGINTRVDIALSSISDINENINELTTLVNNLQNTCTTLTSDLNLLASRIDALETNDTWQNDQISSLTTFTQLNTNNVSALNTLVDNINDNIAALETNDTWQNDQISSLTTFTQLNTNNINALNTLVDNISDDIDALELLIQNTNTTSYLDSANSFERSPTPLEPTNIYNLWEYPANVDTDKTLVNIQTSFSTSGDTTQITIHTPNGASSVLPTSFGSIVNPATLNIDFMYKITNNVMEWYGIYTLTIKGKYPIINYFSADTQYPHKNDKTYPLSNTHLGISFSDAKVWLQPHVKITKYILGG